MINPLHLELATRLAELLLHSGLKLVSAESCTGGGLAHAVTAVPGSSRWFERGFVTYSNDSKRELLGVSAATLQDFGAVSEQTAVAMAVGALHQSHGDISVAITGIAGPDGGSADKPVGTVCLAWAQGSGATRSAQVLLPGDRDAIRDQSVALALQGLLDMVEASG
ncbi:MAG: damage-inducible protein CinA [Gammaproteobacteria bacterium RIFCSPLOWO2_02_FULL_61_13]|nr:MAG: damage-inducible protein CinA [Gammaproteobacteria bacterium RIFCSPLOWO2_02_FULL_61_13]